jgi:PAP2 superfamily
MPGLAQLGTGSLGLLAGRRIWSAGEERRLLYYAFLPPLLFVLLGYGSSALLDITDRLHPSTLDLFLFNFDASLGLQPSFEAGQLVLRSHWLTRIAFLFYFALPIPVMLIYAKQLVRGRSAAMAAFLGFFIVGPAGVIFYNLLPACGPIYLFGSKFPFEPLSDQQVKEMLVHPVLISGVRNAFPSLHVAWALLASWYAQGLSDWTKFFALLFLAGTVLATLGLGEHYFIDLVVALPFALMIQAGCALKIPWRDRRRYAPFLCGLILILGWIAVLRLDLGIMWVSRLVPWTLIACTVVSCLVLQPWLEHPVPEFETKT